MVSATWIGCPEGNSFGAVPINIRRSDGGDSVGYVYSQLLIPGVSPDHIAVGVVNVTDIIIQANGGECLSFGDALIRDVRHHRRVVDSRYGEGRPILIIQTARIGSPEGNRLRTVPVKVGWVDSGDPVGYVYGQLHIPGVSPDHVAVRIIYIYHVIVQVDGGENLTFRNGLIRDVRYHRRIAYCGDGKRGSILIIQTAWIGGSEGDNLGTVPVRTRNGDSSYPIGYIYCKLTVPAVSPDHIAVGMVNVTHIIIQADGGKSLTLGDSLIRNVCHHRCIVD